MSKRTEQIILACAGLLIGLMTLIMYWASYDEKKLLKEGLRAEASVLERYEESPALQQRKSRECFLRLAVFRNSHAPLPSAKLSQKINRDIDDVFVNEPTDTLHEDFETLTIRVTSTSYERYQRHDRVTIVYHKDRLAEARLLDDL